MRRRAASLASSALGAAAVVGMVYLAIALAQVRAFGRRRSVHSQFSPPVTVLKPLFGMEAELEENLASFCRQDYPLYQVLFCATDPNDEAVAVARRVVAQFPSVDAEVVVNEPGNVPNPKIANVLSAEEHVKYDLIAISDADMRVGPNYLRAIAAPFGEPEVGAVTCLYGGVTGREAEDLGQNVGTASALAAMFVNDHFAPSVLVARAVERLSYCFGSTMAVRRSALAQIGGLRALGATLADDHALGRRVASVGLRVALASCVTQSVQRETTFRSLWKREVRWARIIRSVRPVGSTLAVVTYALPLAIVAWLARPRSVWRLLVLCAAATLRWSLHRAARDAFAPSLSATPQLIPLRDVLALAVWFASRFGNAIEWKGRSFPVVASVEQET